MHEEYNRSVGEGNKYLVIHKNRDGRRQKWIAELNFKTEDLYSYLLLFNEIQKHLIIIYWEHVCLCNLVS